MFHLTPQAASDPSNAFHVSYQGSCLLLPAGPWDSSSAGEDEEQGEQAAASAQAVTPELCRCKYRAGGGRMEVCDISRHNR